MTSQPRFCVKIVDRKTQEVVHLSSPLTDRMADKVYEGMSINLNHDDYFIEVQEIDGDRTE